MASLSNCLLRFSIVALAQLGCSQVEDAYPDIPARSAFDSTLRHDLEAYFAKADSGPIHVTYELLRKGPTVTGIAYPKYYLWVEVRSGQQLIRVGAVRVAAINKSFEVTNFAPAASITPGPNYVDSVFPAPLLGAIRDHASHAPPVPKRGV